MVADALIGLLAQTSEPIPSGWLAVGGALGITVTTVMVVRRLERGSIDDLERALERARDEIALRDRQLGEQREQAAKDLVSFRDEIRHAREEIRLVRDENESLRMQLRESLDSCSVLRRQVHRLQREVQHAEGAAGIAPLPDPDPDLDEGETGS